MLKRVNVIDEDFEFIAETSGDGEYATITLISDQRDTAEIYVSSKELKEIIDGATYILGMLEQKSE